MYNIEAADLREVPKDRPIFWALDAYYMGNECPLLAPCPLSALPSR